MGQGGLRSRSSTLTTHLHAGLPRVVTEQRITELELELMAQRDLLDTLNQELTSANDRIGLLEKRADRLERQLESMAALLEDRPNEKPPHY